MKGSHDLAGSFEVLVELFGACETFVEENLGERVGKVLGRNCSLAKHG